MKTKVSVIERLKKEVIPGINLFELCLFTFSTIIGITLFILSITIWNDKEITNSNYIGYLITIIDIPLGVLAATFLSKRSKIAPILLGFDAILYGTSNFLAGNFALFFVNAIISPFIYLIAFFFLWPKQKINPDTNEIETKKLNIKSGIIIFGSLIIISISFGITITFIGDGPQTEDHIAFQYASIWFDSFAASLMLISVIAAVLRYREVWYLFFSANVVKIILFSWSLAIGNMDDLMILVLAISYFINSIFGMIVWKDSKLILINEK